MLKKILPTAKEYIEEIIEPTDHVVDATCGNGHDSQFLSSLVPKGTVYSFDIQKDAILKAKETYPAPNIHFIQDGHENVDQYIQENIKAAIFNLGYLPGGNKSITTIPETTVTALNKLFTLLSVGGRIAIVVYHGHESGKIERDQLINELSKWPQDTCQVLEYKYINQKNHAPFLLLIEKSA
ncbi:class I SAM-dependent methyltransferase [Jeotgalicoccus sp. ATCC 8456]|uniref:class I SAM-dependent methyltransferase n=1 Tax=Jeotgalicoccus sp. ATCC 8456 TaxID=946435 RepID=UPI0018E61884|nr:class I SAM-dependent methyltransferase [Jeotgalicoccus sp. ATCC 8456]QQD85177.1 class I SAM-dependent methyltransferase [Jeotgalicoccus sp. ATCC 8456]